MTSRPSIRQARIHDAQAICSIYNHYIQNSVSTFDLQPQYETQWQRKIQTIRETHPFLVLEIDNKIRAYAYATKWKDRMAYRFTCESSIYVHPTEHAKGYGKLLYQRLFEELKDCGYKLVLAGISLPNDPSVKFHELLGFKHQGTLKAVGTKFNRWIDVGYWALRLD